MSEQEVSSKKSKSISEIEKAKEEVRLRLWQSRLAFLKRGNAAMKNKMFSEAAICYEKYLKLVEMVYQAPANGLEPNMFKESARTTELSIVASVYWDLVRIYDIGDKFADRQKIMAAQLVKFVPLTPIYSEILRKAEIFQRKSKRPEVIKSMISKMGRQKGRCFIATAAFEDAGAYEVQCLRVYRDNVLKKSWLGRQFVFYYYKISPYIAQFLDHHPNLKSPVKKILTLVIKCVS